MPYGQIKVDEITFTNAGVDQTISVSGVVASISGNITATGTISGDVIRGGTLVSGATVTGTAGQFGTITGNAARFTTVTGTTVTGTTANFVTVSGTTVTGTTAQFTTVTGGTAGFTTITGTTVTGTTANFVTVSGTTVTGNVGNFTTVTGGTVTLTSGVFAAGSATNPSISFTSDPNSGLFSPGADQVAISTNGSGRLFVDSSGRTLIGTSSSRSWGGGISSQFQIENTGSGSYTSQSIIANTNDTVGGLLVLGKSRGTSLGSNTAVQNNDLLGRIYFYGADGSGLTQGATIEGWVDGTPGSNDMPGRLVFSTTADGASSPTERVRIDNAGRTMFGKLYNETSKGCMILPDDNNTGRFQATGDNSSSGASFLVSNALGNATYIVRPNGNVLNTNNSYGAISDIKLKENIVDAASQWEDLKALQVRKYNLKEGQTHTQIGLIAQEVELVSPGLVSESPDRDEDGNDLGTVTKSVNYSVLYMKAVKALQEAMERIEQLETEMAAVKAQLS